MKTHRQNKRPLPVPGTVLDKERADRRQHAQGSGLSQRGRDALFLQPSGFTLVELLIVIAIIAILFGLLATGLSRAKTAAQRIVCLNNLKQWGSATHIYAHENDDHLPREAAFDGINPWEATGSPTNSDVWYNALPATSGIRAMKEYAQTPSSQQNFYSDKTIFHCPSARFSAVAATYPNFSLAMNSKLMRDFESGPPLPPSSPPPEQCKLSEIKAPDRTALFLDNGVPGETRLCSFQPPYTGQPKAYASQFPGRHNRSGNLVFADGHALTLQGTKVVDMDPASAFRGSAIYPPVEVVWRQDPSLVP